MSTRKHVHDFVTANAQLACDHFGDLVAKKDRRVVVTGLGLVTPLGVGVSKVWEALLARGCGIRGLVASDLPEEQQAAFSGLPSKVAGVVCKADLQSANHSSSAKEESAQPKCVKYALAAAAEALNATAGLRIPIMKQDARWQPLLPVDRERTGVGIGVGMSATAELAHAGQLVGAGKPRRLSPFLVPRSLANMAAGAVSMQHQLLGPNHCVSTACTTGAHSVGDAYNFIRHGDADVMVAGGSEACIDAVAMGGFCRMRALETRFNANPAASCRPFDANRGGFVIGEGAGVLILEELQHAMSRGARIYAEVRGYGLSGDAFHVTQPAPDGRGAILAMRRALYGSNVSPADVVYINAHATGTPLGDAVEAAAIAKVFDVDPTSSGRAGSKRLAVSSTKGATGHLLGAAGAVEAVFCVLALQHSVAPPTLNLEKEDPCTLDSTLVGAGPRPLRTGAKAVLSNSFGFGGTNASLLFSSPPG